MTRVIPVRAAALAAAAALAVPTGASGAPGTASAAMPRDAGATEGSPAGARQSDTVVTQRGSPEVRLESLSIHAGTALERYGGTFSVVTVPLVDSTDHALAGGFEWGAAGLLRIGGGDRVLRLSGDASLRQLVTSGFRQQNYAPREQNGWLGASYRERLGRGAVAMTARLDARSVVDLPPMPLYLPPGHASYMLGASYSRTVADDMELEGGMTFDERDYAGPGVLPTLDLLDRSTVELRGGARRHSSSLADPLDRWTLGFFASYLRHRYPRQGHRTDDALRVGGDWALSRPVSRGLEVRVSASGTLNRSNSRRVEHNSAQIEASMQKFLGRDLLLSFEVTWTGRSYLSPQGFLIPGEEADNATILVGEVTRILSPDLEASLGASWTRAGTNITGDSYERTRLSFSLRAHPRF